MGKRINEGIEQSLQELQGSQSQKVRLLKNIPHLISVRPKDPSIII